jgi:hypothetical protein
VVSAGTGSWWCAHAGKAVAWLTPQRVQRGGNPDLGDSRKYHGNIMGYNIMGYPLVMTNSLPWYRWPIEIDGLAIKNGDFPWLC